MRRRTDRLYPQSLGPRHEQAVAIVTERPGITVAELAVALDVGMNRAWQILGRLEHDGRITRDGEPRRYLGPRRSSDDA